MTFVGSELESVTVRPPAGATVGSVTCRGVVCPMATVGFAIRVIVPPPWTVMDAVTPARLGFEAVMTADPVVSPVTANVADEAPGAIETEAGMEMMPA